MTLKSYLRMLLAAVTLMFVTSGCNDDEKKVGPPPSYTFGIAVSDVTETEATVTVTPSNDQATYYYGAVKKADFDAFESDAAYAQNILATLKAAADRKVLSLEEYLQTALSKGSSPKKISDLMAGTDYYAVAIGILTDGRLTSDLVKEAFKTEATPEPDMVFSITMTPGYNGADTHTKMSVNFKVSERPAVSGKYLLGPTTFIEQQLAAGKSYDDILDTGTNVYDFAADELTELNSEQGTVGENWVWGKLTPETSYTVVARVKDAEGNSILKTAEKSTEAAQGGGEGPELSIEMIPGLNGADTDTKMTVNFKASGKPAVGGKYMLAPTSAYEAVLAQGATYDDIIEANGAEFTAEELTELNSAQGTQGWYWDERTPETSYTAVAKVYDADGNSTLKYEVKSTTASQSSGGGPALEVGIVAGYQGQDTQTKITASFRVTGKPAAVSGKYLMVPKSAVDEVVAQGASYDDIMDYESNGAAFTAEDLTKLNSTGGVGWYWENRTPGTEYIAMAKVKDAAGNSTLKYAVASTYPAGEASEDYKAWLGTWTVTSTSSVVNAKPVSFDVVFSEKIANQKYTVSGWGTTIFREDEPVEALFDAESGSFGFANEQELTTFEQDGKTFAFKYASVCSYPGGYTVVRGDYIGLLGQLDASKNQANVIGNELTLTDDSKAKVVSMEFFALQVGGNGLGTYPAADGFVDDDYPIGPYTMTRKSASTSMPARKSAVHTDSQMYASKLSSVLSTSLVVSAPAKQNFVKAQASDLNTLSFVKHAAVYKAKISNMVSIEKPLGLKKHFIKK